MEDKSVVADQARVILGVHRRITEIVNDIRKRRIEFRKENKLIYDELDEANADLVHELSILDELVKRK
jgi:hypothetical protein